MDRAKTNRAWTTAFSARGQIFTGVAAENPPREKGITCELLVSLIHNTGTS
jgi:hypothetical protein